MKRKMLRKMLCAMLVCLQVFAGGLVVYAHDGGTYYETVLPRDLGSDRGGNS